MTSSSSAQHPAAENACRITLGQANQVRPKLPLLKILQAAGAQGETFTLKEVMHYLGQYIMVRQLYDKRQQHMVYCGGDQLGELLGLESFSVKDPSPVYEMLKRNLTSAAMTDAAQNLAKEQSVDKPSQDQLKFSPKEGSDTVIMGDESNASAVSTSEHKCENYEDKDLIENLSKSKKPKLDLVFEEWDVAGLPWWFLGNLRSNYKSRSNGSTDIQTNQDIDTAIVSDTTDDLWFLNESPLDQTNTAVKMETADCEEVKEGDKKVTEDACLHDFEDSQCLSDDTDTEAASEDLDERGDPVLLYALHSREALPEKERWHLSSGSLICVQVARCFHQAEDVMPWRSPRGIQPLCAWSRRVGTHSSTGLCSLRCTHRCSSPAGSSLCTEMLISDPCVHLSCVQPYGREFWQSFSPPSLWGHGTQ
ncbi:protein Mdm4 isoform X3 [Gallus gallus]|uniref:protein Mdm4 isoform X3 n=1 Tax=Gallus gallus TaxID=9031 RepID=UPI001F0033EE|nr:protein Mdm4 isoform X3 [Gallus gallus]